jgi:hypothetical protein
MSTTPPVPPDIQLPNPSQNAPAPIATDNPQPAAPPKETFSQGIRRGAGGTPYFVDAQGNITSARSTSNSAKGTFGSILAETLMSALAGAGKARPGGIPSHELSGGFGAGVGAGMDRNNQVDQRNRQRAQQDFENRNTAKEVQNKDLAYKAQLHISDLTGIKLAHEIDVAQREDPIKYQNLVNSATQSQLDLEAQAKNLGLINERTYKDYASVPKADIDKFNRQQVKILALPDGGVKVWDRTFDARTTPNTDDFQVRSLVGLDSKGKPEWKVEGNVKAGSGTVAQQEAELDKQRTQRQEAAKNNAQVEKDKATARKETAEALVNEKQAALLQNLGVNVPAGYVPPAGLFQMSAPQAKAAIGQSGTQVPPDFDAMYAIGHYDADLKTYTNRQYKGNIQRTQPQVLAYIRTFINPDFHEQTYADVQALEKSFSAGKDAQALSSFNAAIGHLGQLSDIAQQLKNGQTPAWNAIANALSQQTGQAIKPNYDSIKGVLVGETGRLMKNAAPDVNEMAEISKTLSSSSSPEQFAGAIQQYADAMMTKGNENIQRYYDWTGKLPPHTFSPQTQAVFQKLGIKNPLPSGAKTTNTPNQNQNQNAHDQAAAAIVPPAVASVLKDASVGRHTLSDKTVWDKLPDGSIKQVTATPQGQP